MPKSGIDQPRLRLYGSPSCMAGIVLAAYIAAPSQAAASRIEARWEHLLEPVLRLSQPERAPSWSSVLDDADAKASTIPLGIRETREHADYV